MSDSDSNSNVQVDQPEKPDASATPAVDQPEKPDASATPAVDQPEKPDAPATPAVDQPVEVRETVVVRPNQLTPAQTQRLAMAINTGSEPGNLDDDENRVDLDASGNPAQTNAVAPADSPTGQSAETDALVAELDQRVRDCDSDMAEIDGQIAQLQSHRRQVEQERDGILQKKREIAPPPSQAQAIQQYLAQQQRNREARYNNTAAMLGRQVARAPIDAARAVRPGHGAAQVKYPNLVNTKQT